MPDFTGRYLKQGTVGTYGSESLPNITGKTGNVVSNSNQAEGCFTETIYSTGVIYDTNPFAYLRTVNFDASLSSSAYQNNAKVNPVNAEILYVIKY